MDRIQTVSAATAAALDNVRRPMLQCALRYVQKVDQEMSIYISLDVLP